MTTNWPQLRCEFPYLEECVYLNTAAAGLAPSAMGAAAAQFYASAKIKGINGMPIWQAKATEVREEIAALLGVDTRNVIFLSNTAEGMNIVSQSTRLRNGDRLVYMDDEHPNVVNPWLMWEQHGVRIHRVSVEKENCREDCLLNSLGKNVRVLVASHVQWTTGTALNLHRLAAACHAVGALLVVDGVQAIGAVPVDLRDDVDAYCAAVFKWLLAGFGLSVLIVSDWAIDQMEPAFRGAENPPPSKSLHYSHWNYPGIFVLDYALKLMKRVGWSTVFERVQVLRKLLTSGLLIRGYAVVTPSETQTAITSFRVPDAVSAVESLERRGISVAERGGYIRVSPHFYNNERDIERFLAAIQAIAPPTTRYVTAQRRF